MGTINVVEYDRLPDLQGLTVPMNPARTCASRSYTSDGSSDAADAPADDTRCLRVAVVEAHYVELDDDATTDSRLMPAGSVEWFEVGVLHFMEA